MHTPEPNRHPLIVIFSAFHCHHDGSPAVLYAPQHQVLISGGKRGDVCIFDVRQRQIKHTFQAHDSAIRCMTLDPTEQYFVTGAADGDIKVRTVSQPDPGRCSCTFQHAVERLVENLNDNAIK